MFGLNGDVNLDGVLNILDIVLFVNQIFSDEYNEIYDLSGDGILNILDIVLLINMIL